jgi:hypothetical protein
MTQERALQRNRTAIDPLDFALLRSGRLYHYRDSRFNLFRFNASTLWFLSLIGSHFSPFLPAPISQLASPSSRLPSSIFPSDLDFFPLLCVRDLFITELKQGVR